MSEDTYELLKDHGARMKNLRDQRQGSNTRGYRSPYTQPPRTKEENQRVVDECNKRRDTYCNKGADFIRKEQEEKAMLQREMAEETRRNRGNVRIPGEPDLIRKEFRRPGY